MSKFGEQCVSLRKQDYSILDISRITGKAKSSIYPYIKDLPLSEERIQAFRIANKTHLQKISALRKGKSLKEFKKFSNWSTDTVLLVSHFRFDGGINLATCAYNNRSTALIKRVKNLMKKVYDFGPKYYRNTLTGVTRISYHNVAMASYMQKKSDELIALAPTFPNEYKREILRAFFDDEGCMDFRPKKNIRRIRGYQKDWSTLILIQQLLQDFKIESILAQPNEVVIRGKGNLEKFQKEIGFSKGIYINGNRTNSRWKKHLEKRDLLSRAIASFKS